MYRALARKRRIVVALLAGSLESEAPDYVACGESEPNLCPSRRLPGREKVPNLRTGMMYSTAVVGGLVSVTIR
jgi:hypothetical protein